MKILSRTVLFICFVIILVGCRPVAAPIATEPPTPTPTDAPTSTGTTEPTSTLTLVPTETLLPTETSTPTITLTPTIFPTAEMPDGTGGLPWWNDVVFYQIFVRSFYDSDGDGDGDFQGIIEKLDYLNDGNPDTTFDLGVGGIWLMPIHPSPSYHGYDVLDYYAVNPDYGTMEDFQRLLDEAHKRGIRVIIDFVINHTSDQHPWFEAAQDPESEYHDWYVWTTGLPQYEGPWGQKVWHQALNGMKYYAIFWGGMPDLNYQNPLVREEILKISEFWLDEVGVDGFRVDGARYLYANEEAQADQPETLAFYEDWRAAYKADNPDAFVVGEVWTSLEESSVYDPDTGMDTIFAFDLAEAIINGVSTKNAWQIQDAYLETMAVFDEGQFSAFLTNHDVDRIMVRFGEDHVKMRLAAFTYLTGPGVPFIYYGEEIGMLGAKPDEQIRTPMQWSADANAGFTTGIPWNTAQLDYEEKNVAVQLGASESLLTLYQRLVHLRNTTPALRIGGYSPVSASETEIYAALRYSEGQAVLLLANLSLLPVDDFTLSLPDGPLSGAYSATAILGAAEASELVASDTGGFNDYSPVVQLGGGEFLILVLE